MVPVMAAVMSVFWACCLEDGLVRPLEFATVELRGIIEASSIIEIGDSCQNNY